jgi:predicted Fe-Mo cluster-binding NifX family protein
MDQEETHMVVVVTAKGRDLDAPISPIFGRCSTFILVDMETMEYEALENPAVSAPGGAGIQAAQFVIDRGARAVLTGNVGPNASGVFRTADMPVYLVEGGTVRDALETYGNGLLQTAKGATVASHSGMQMGRGRGLR